MRKSAILLKHSYAVAGKQLFMGDVTMDAHINQVSNERL